MKNFKNDQKLNHNHKSLQEQPHQRNHTKEHLPPLKTLRYLSCLLILYIDSFIFSKCNWGPEITSFKVASGNDIVFNFFIVTLTCKGEPTDFLKRKLHTYTSKTKVKPQFDGNKAKGRISKQ